MARFGERNLATSTDRPHGLMFHHFHDESRVQTPGSVSAEQFDRILDRLEPGRVLPAREWAERASDGRLEPHDLCLTFDDGLRCQFDVALPVMQRRGMTGFWFVYSSVLSEHAGPIEVHRRFRYEHFQSVDEFYQAFLQAADLSEAGGRVRRALDVFPRDYLADHGFYTIEDRRFRYIRDKVLSPDEYASLMDSLMRAKGVNAENLARALWLDEERCRALRAEGHVIGLHSHSHPTALGDLAVERQREEYGRNFEILHAILAERPFAMAHPSNSYSAATLSILRDMGIRVGFRSNMASDSNGNLEWPRRDSADLLDLA